MRDAGEDRLDTAAASAAPAEQANCAALVARLQTAPCGDAGLDRQMARALAGLHRSHHSQRGPQGGPQGRPQGRPQGHPHGRRPSRALGDALLLLPDGFNFSLGLRDGIFWAWVQPNDGWEPGADDARHDHPGGSGLVVAYTAALALSAAVVRVYAQGVGRGQAGGGQTEGGHAGAG